MNNMNNTNNTNNTKTQNNLAKRIIPCLDIQRGQVAKGIQFNEVKAVGDPIALAQYYEEQGADELVFYDIHASVEMRATFLSLVEQIARSLRIPFTVGGGIQTVDDVYSALLSGADKVSVNSAIVLTPELLYNSAKRFGNQCMVASIDVKRIGESYYVFTHGGRNQTSYRAEEWAMRCESLGAGELVINAIDQDGMKRGYDLALLKAIKNSVKIPVIASGGAGKLEDFTALFEADAADAALAASVFHYNTVPIPLLKAALDKEGVAVRLCQ